LGQILSWAPIDNATKYTLTVSTNPNFTTTFKTVSQAGTTYALSGLANGATYYWHVKEAAPLAGTWSVPWKFTAPVAPAAPALLKPANAYTWPLGTVRPVFIWKAAVVPANGKPVEHYHLQIAQKNTFASLDLDEYTKDASLTYTTPYDLTPNRVYYWRVRAFNTSAGYSKWSSVYSFKILPGEVGLDEVENGDSLLRPTFHWHDDWRTGKYNIQICKRTSGTICSLFKSATVTDLSYTLAASLLPHTLYNWRVQAVGTSGAGAWTEYGDWTTPTPPASPIQTWPAANAILPDATHPGYTPTLDWSDVTGTGITYALQVSTDAGFFDWSTFTYDNTPDSFQLVNELLRNQVYWWRVRACDSSSVCSVWTVARKLTTKPDVPVSTGQNQIDSTGVYAFNWSDFNQNSAGKYNIQVCNNATCSSIFKSATVTNSWQYQLLLPSDKDKWWRVQGVGITTGNWMDPIQYFHTVVTPGVPVLVSPAASALVALPMAIPPNIPFRWQPVTGANGYQIQIAYNTTSFDAPDVDQNVGGTSVGAVAYGTSYWRVRANISGNWGQWSAARKFLVKPAVGGYIETWQTDGSPQPISGATVTMTGNISSMLGSDATGLYYMPPNLPTGAKTLIASKSGYLPQTRNLTLANGGNYLPTNFWLAPVNPDNNVYRFVLSWDSPVAYRDLDLHAWLPAATPSHIFWGNTGSLSGFPNARLVAHDMTPTVEVLDIGLLQPGKYVIGANQYYPASGPWSGTNVRVDVFKGTDLQMSCLAPAGTGLWWYVMDVNVAGGIPVFTCKNKVQAAIPVTTPDQTISGTIKQVNGHAVQDVLMNYGEGSANVGSPYTLSGLGNGSHTLIPSKTTGALPWTFTLPSLTVPVGTADANFIANPPPTLMTGGDPVVVAVQGDYVYVGGGGKLYIVNVQDKTNPVVVSSFWIATDPIVDVAVQGNYAYVAELSADPTGSSALDIVDISDPTDPTIVGTYVGTVKTVTVSGYYAYLTSGMDFIILDIHDPAKPSVVKDYFWDTAAANHVLVKDNYAYVGGEAGVWVFNVTNPSSPVYVTNWTSDSGDPIVGIAWNNGRLIVTDSNLATLTGRIYDLNIDDPSNVRQDYVTDLPYGDIPFQTTAVGNTLYVADGTNGLLVYDISQPWDDIPLLATLVPEDATYGVAAQDIFAYVIDAGSVKFVNASRRDAPAPAGSYTPTP
jgi:hypothetical protein